jgi:hypothetical protein
VGTTTRSVPPGHSGASQYTETLPTAGGEQPTAEIHHGGATGGAGEGGSSGGGSTGGGSTGGTTTTGGAPAATPAATLGARNAKRLEKLGPRRDWRQRAGRRRAGAAASCR